jgi:methylmalonyl-CoA mutase
MADAPDTKPRLASEFSSATRAQWLKLVDAVLKGRSFEEKLVARTYDGLAVEPLYGRHPHARPVAARIPSVPWQVMARVDHPDPAAANAQALDDLENGATGLSLVFAGSIGARGYGLDASETTIDRVLDDIQLDAGIAIELDLSPLSTSGRRRPTLGSSWTSIPSPCPVPWPNASPKPRRVSSSRAAASIENRDCPG